MPATTTARRKIQTRKTLRPAPSLREIIRNTARELFAKEGYASVSMRRIGAEIGCSPMAMYRHYASKDELLVSICEETFTKMIKLIDARREKPGTALEKLRSCLRTIIDFHLSHPNHYKVTFMTEIPPGPAADRKVAIGQPTLDRLRKGIQECAEAKGIEVDLELMTQIMRAGMHGLVAMLIITQRPYPVRNPERLKQELIMTLTKSLE
ncbi:MAG TPA: TetR/AcrR family transcriptional regulator [Candidatus Angelobacter sp.]|nr:TetR/AcrR family transcriptional regulator [Candidatus Angelobacter sp.]